jgi:hypothetical protein
MIPPLQNYPGYGGGQGFSSIAIAEFVTLVSLAICFFLFLSLAIRFRHAEGGILHSFKLQLSIAILLWILGELLSVFASMSYWRMYFHTTSMALFAFFLLYRVRALAGR